MVFLGLNLSYRYLVSIFSYFRESLFDENSVGLLSYTRKSC